jgi:hypothetical protein
MASAALCLTIEQRFAPLGRRLVKRLDVVGDAQGDRNAHGGEHRAILVCQIESHRYWEAHLGRSGFTSGQFGENFTVEDLPDDQVCIGDRYRIGSALFKVTQPRVTCYRVGIRMNEPEMAASLAVPGSTSGSFRKLRLEPEMKSLKSRTGPERMTVAEIDALLYLPGTLSPICSAHHAFRHRVFGWKESFRALLDRRAVQGRHPAPPGSELGRALPLVWASELWRKEDLRKLASLSALENR